MRVPLMWPLKKITSTCYAGYIKSSKKVMRFDKNNDLLSESAAIVSQILSTTVVTTVVLMEICLENLYVDIGA